MWVAMAVLFLLGIVFILKATSLIKEDIKKSPEKPSMLMIMHQFFCMVLGFFIADMAWKIGDRYLSFSEVIEALIFTGIAAPAALLVNTFLISKDRWGKGDRQGDKSADRIETGGQRSFLSYALDFQPKEEEFPVAVKMSLRTLHPFFQQLKEFQWRFLVEEITAALVLKAEPVLAEGSIRRFIPEDILPVLAIYRQAGESEVGCKSLTIGVPWGHINIALIREEGYRIEGDIAIGPVNEDSIAEHQQFMKSRAKVATEAQPQPQP